MTSASFCLLMALIGEFGFMSISILAKRLRNRGITTLSLIAAYGLTLPVWAVAVGYYALQGQLQLSWAYAAILSAWLGTCFFLNFGSIYLTRFQSLSEGTGYRFGFSTLIALFVDLLIFKTTFHPTVLMIIIMLFCGGFLLHLSREKTVSDPAMRLPLPQRLGFILLISLAEVSTYGLFKLAAGMQISVFLHNSLSQMLMFMVFLAAGGRTLRQDYKDRNFPSLYLIALFVLMIVAAVADGYAIAGLPVTLFIMFSLIRTACFAAHDIQTSEMKLTPLSGLALVLIAVGLACTVMIKEI